MSKWLLFIFLSVFISTSVFAQKNQQKRLSIKEKTQGMEKHSGYFNFYWDKQQGKIWLEIDKFDIEFLYVNYLSEGAGSNDIGLDRGMIGGNRVVRFYKSGNKVLLIEPNYNFRAFNGSSYEKKAVNESFARSVIFGFHVEIEEKGKVLVDANQFFIRDAVDVSGMLMRTEQGTYGIDESRSAFYMPRTKNFPENSEIDVITTFTGTNPGEYVWEVVPSPKYITVHQHHSLIKLPDEGFEMREFDPRAGYFGLSFKDYATPISEPLVKRYIFRHRLKKVNAGAKRSIVIKPLIYYVDRAMPEPIRSAIMDGAQWWKQAFEAIGYINAFQVKLLPEDVDPLDVRYNVIQWVHRSTRGWSYGGSVTDPRTGEIIKGHISLGSLRVRQDYLIAEALLAPYEKGKNVSKEMEKMALARIRQLAVHEVGHTLGLAHNYVASTVNRASVMDYPAPYVLIDANGKIDLSNAYAEGVGEWDKVAIAYGYQDFPLSTNIKDSLDQIIENSFSKGLMYLSDKDARPAGSAHPLAHLWDNGSNAIDELNRVMKVREYALNHFSEKNIPEGRSYATLEDALVPLYMFHRYQLEACTKLIGGLYYRYAMRGDGQEINKIVPAKEQRRSLEAVLNALKPEALIIPENILKLIPPRPAFYPKTREHFKNRTGLTFDPLSANKTLVDFVLSIVLHPERAARLVEYHARDNQYPGLAEVIDRLLESSWSLSLNNSYHTEILRVIDNSILNHLMSLAVDEHASGQVEAIVLYKLEELKNNLVQKNKNTKDINQKAHYLLAISKIKQFQQNPSSFKIQKALEPPDGPPIGNGAIMNSFLNCW